MRLVHEILAPVTFGRICTFGKLEDDAATVLHLSGDALILLPICLLVSPRHLTQDDRLIYSDE